MVTEKELEQLVILMREDRELRDRQGKKIPQLEMPKYLLPFNEGMIKS